jgi:hypothetical protein
VAQLIQETITSDHCHPFPEALVKMVNIYRKQIVMEECPSFLTQSIIKTLKTLRLVVPTY